MKLSPNTISNKGHYKMSPNAIPNNTFLAKDTLKSIDEAPVLAWEHLFVPRPESEGGRQKIIT